MDVTEAQPHYHKKLVLGGASPLQNGNLIREKFDSNAENESGRNPETQCMHFSTLTCHVFQHGRDNR